MQPASSIPQAYTGSRASYVVLASCTMLGLGLIISAWQADASGSVAVLGLLAVYLASQEILALFLVFLAASALVDLFRLGGPVGTRGRFWLVFLQLLQLAAKAAGAAFAWSLHRAVASGQASSSYPGGPPALPGHQRASYQRVQDPFQSAYAPPGALSVPIPGSQAFEAQQPQHTQLQAQPQQQAATVQRAPAAAAPAPAPVPAPQPAAPNHELL